MPKLTINGNEIEVKEGLTVMQACESAGIEIPHFCFHERLKIAGNCRMCLKPPFEGAEILDLFAGTGSLSFEGLSRGAKTITLLDNNKDHLKVAKGFAVKIIRATAKDSSVPKSTRL